MDNIHNLTILPEQQAINSVAAFAQEFNCDGFDLYKLLIELKRTIIESNFMLGHNNFIWMSKYAPDFLTTPKLFATAPLTYICVFLGEIFNNFEIEEIIEKVPQASIEHALMRLQVFKLHS